MKQRIWILPSMNSIVSSLPIFQWIEWVINSVFKTCRVLMPCCVHDVLLNLEWSCTSGFGLPGITLFQTQLRGKHIQNTGWLIIVHHSFDFSFPVIIILVIKIKSQDQGHGSRSGVSVGTRLKCQGVLLQLIVYHSFDIFLILHYCTVTWCWLQKVTNLFFMHTPERESVTAPP